MIKSHVLYRLSYGLSHSTRALKAKEGPASSVTKGGAPARGAGHRP
jgi:hypothetical protein